MKSSTSEILNIIHRSSVGDQIKLVTEMGPGHSTYTVGSSEHALRAHRFTHDHCGITALSWSPLFMETGNVMFDWSELQQLGSGFDYCREFCKFTNNQDVLTPWITGGVYIHSLYVASEHRRKGLGTALLRDFEHTLCERYKGGSVMFMLCANSIDNNVDTDDLVRFYHWRHYDLVPYSSAMVKVYDTRLPAEPVAGVPYTRIKGVYYGKR